MLVVDRSGSMGAPGTSGPGRTKMDEAREAASLFVQLIRVGAGDRVGLVSFSTNATHPPDTSPASITAAFKQQLIGPSPYTGGTVGGLAPGGSTSIGAGLKEGVQALAPLSGNTQVLLLLTDGLQNTPPMIADVEAQLGTTKVLAIGFGADYNLDGALLSKLALDHQGMYTRANNGLELSKFFALAFGNIFANGTLADPTFVLESGVNEAEVLTFPVSDEDRITAVFGWDVVGVELELDLVTPDGAIVTEGTAGTTGDRALTWSFLVVPLPFAAEREGIWRVVVRRRSKRGAGPRVRYFVSVVADGGPRLTPLLPSKPVYTGDRVIPMVGLFYKNVTTPEAEITVTVDSPDGSVGALVAQAGLASPAPNPDSPSAFTTTLQQIAAQSGGALPIGRRTTTIELFDDGVHGDGGMEPDGVYANLVDDLTRFEGTYTFRAVATYGETYPGRREAVWSLHVEPGIDPAKSTVTVVGSVGVARGGRAGWIVVTPRDRYGSPLGPGRGDRVTLTVQPGTQLTGGVTDNGDGSYSVPVAWDPSVPGAPAVVVTQPGRDPVVLGPTARGGRCPRWLCWLLGALVVVLAVVVVILLLD